MRLGSGLALVSVALAVASCGASGATVTRTVLQTRTVLASKPPDLGPPTQEARTTRLPFNRSFSPPRGTATVQPFTSGGGCGLERWAVKTMTDPLSGRVVLSPKATTIARLIAIKPPINPTDRVAPTEETTYRISGVITLVKQEADSDYHIVIEDPKGNTMIVEATSPACDTGSLAATQIAQVRKAMDKQFGGRRFTGHVPATVTGVGFFDRLHGQTGVAPNGIELHPLTSVLFGSAAGVPPAARTVPPVALGNSTKSD